MSYIVNHIDRYNDERSPRMRSLISMSNTPPASLNRSRLCFKPKPYENLTLGDCTAAALANAAEAQCALYGYQIKISDQDVLKFYSLSTGYVEGYPFTDVGGIESNVLAYASKNGFTIGTQTLYPSFGSISKHDFFTACMCMAIFGSVYAGFNLTALDGQKKGLRMPIFDTSDDNSDNSIVTDRHCALLWDYTGMSDKDTVSIISWGRIYKATWRWIRSRCTEMHGIGFHQLLPQRKDDDEYSHWDEFVKKCNLNDNQ